MLRKIEIGGYIVTDDDNDDDPDSVLGVGATEEAAWEDMLAGREAIGPGSIRANDFKTLPASKALLKEAKTKGGDKVPWHIIDGVACTLAER
jgi:hypothetical protein